MERLGISESGCNYVRYAYVPWSSHEKVDLESVMLWKMAHETRVTSLAS